MQKLSTAAAFFLVFVPVTAASADSLIPVRLQVAGAEVRGSVPPVWDGKEWHAPLEVLEAVGLRGEVKGRGSTLSLKSAGRSGELRLTRRTGQPMLRLTELARFLDADIRRPARLLKDGEPAPVKPGDWVYLLARVRAVRVADGTVRIDTSFPVPVRTGVDENSERLEDVLECVGATLPEGFAPAPVPEGETRVRSVSVVEQKPGLVRVTLGLKDTVSTCAPGEQKEAPGEEKEAPGEQKEAPPVEPLRLDDVLRQVQAYYPKLSAADAERRIAAAKRLEKEGAFDPRFYSGSDVSRFPSDTPGSLKSFNTSEAGLELLTPYGIKVITGGRINRGDVKSPLSPTGESGEYFVGLKVPLFGGAGINEKLAALRQSRLGVPLADTEFHEFRLDVLLKAAVTYWDWAAAGQRLQVAKDLLELAQVRAKAVKDRADAGDLPLIDVAEANQEVQRRVEGLEKAQRDLQKEMFKLSLFLWEPDGSPRALPSARQLPTVPAPAGELKEEEVEAGRSAALERRPELKALAVNRQITQVGLDLARNQRLPAVELSLAPGLDTGIGGAGGTMKAGISLGLPLRQRTAVGRIQEAELKLEKLSLDLQLERQRVLTEVDDSVSAVRQTYQRYVAAMQELELARRLEQGERERFSLGDSTLFLVNQRERSTAEAAVKVIALRAEYEQSLALFRAVTTQL